jgi:hypothetical protein
MPRNPITSLGGQVRGECGQCGRKSWLAWRRRGSGLICRTCAKEALELVLREVEARHRGNSHREAGE